MSRAAEFPSREPLVSIVVNNYNYERFLGDAIESALGQTHPHTEVVVVDDGSTDGSREIISGYGDRITPVLKENGGQASAFNAGFAASRGEVVVFLDADDYLFPQVAGRVVAAWEPGLAAVQYRLEQVDALGRPLGSASPPYGVRMESGEVWRILLERGSRVHPPTSGNGFCRTALQQIFPLPEAEWRISADGCLVTLVPFYGRVASIEEPLGAYRLHGGNLWASLDGKNGRETLAQVQYDLRKQELLARRAAALGHAVPRGLSLRDHRRVQYRIASLRLNPGKHPISADDPLDLLHGGLNAVWRYSRLSRRQRIVYSLWFICVGLLPLRMAKPVISWGLSARTRPGVIDRLCGRAARGQ